MAITVSMISVRQDSFFNAESGDVEKYPGLQVRWIGDNYESGSASLLFSEYAGLEAEWADGQGTATTVLDAALDDWLTNNLLTTDDTTSDEISTGRKGYGWSDTP